MSEIKFLKGEYANYKGIASKDENAFYVTNEEASVGNGADGQPIMEQVYALWLGTHLIASGNTAAMLVEETKNRVAKDSDLEERLATLESGDNSVEKQIEKAIADLKAEIEGELGENDAKTLEAINDELDAIDEKIETLNGDDTVDGSVAKDIKDAITALKGDVESYDTLGKLEDAINTVSADAKSYKIEAITEGLATNVKEAFKLVDEDGVQAGATINIYKDSSLEKVELDGQVLKFTYILNDGTISEVPVDVSNFLAENEFADGLIVTDHIVSVDVADATKANTDALVASGKNFLELEADGENHKALAVRSIDTDSTILQKDIVVAGMSGQFGAGNYKNTDVIPAGTDIYTILQNILCKELYPTGVNKITASAGASMSNLTLTLDNTGTQEVGTLVTMTAGKTNGTSASGAKNSQVTGMTYGYSAADDDTIDSTATTITSKVSTAISANDYTIKATLSGFNADTVTNKQTVPAQASGTGSAELAQTALGCVAEGSNTINIYATGASINYKADAIAAVYYGSNLGNTDAAKKFTGVSAVDSTTAQATKSATTTVTGVYKYFLGYSDNTAYNQFDSAAVRALTTKTGNITKDNTTTIVDGNAIKSNGKSIVIACPAKYKLATINNGVGADILANFTSVGTVAVKCGVIDVDYKVYVYPITNSAVVEFKNVTLTKAQ